MTFYVTKTATGLVTEALTLLGVVDESAPLEPFDQERGTKQLGMLLMSIQAEGATMFMRRRECIDLVQGTADYPLSSEGVSSIELIQAMVSTPDVSPSDEQIVTLMSRRDYMDMPGKDTTGRPTQVWFHFDEANGAQVTVWPTPDASYILKLDHREPFTGISDPNAEVEVPDYWMEAIAFNLAHRCAFSFGKAASPEYREIKEAAKGLYDTAAAFDIVQDGGGEVRFAPGVRN